MKPEQLGALLRYRLEQAHETLREAEILLNELAWRGTVNRAYYAMFYALLGLLATKQLGTSKHSGAIALFDREFVKTGIFPRELSRSLHLAFDRRQTYDYGEMTPATRQVAEETLADAKAFVSAIESYLGSRGDSLAKFQVASTANIIGRNHFVLYGKITEGVLREGMTVILPQETEVGTRVAIDGIERVRAPDRSANLGLSLRYENERQLQSLQELDLDGIELEIVASQADQESVHSSNPLF